MRVLVTGGAGYIGSVAAHLLLEKGYEVTVLDDLATGKRKLVPADARYVEGSILDKNAIQLGLGEADEESGNLLQQIYEKMCENNPVFCRMSRLSAEITKIATNCFLTFSKNVLKSGIVLVSKLILISSFIIFILLVI